MRNLFVLFRRPLLWLIAAQLLNLSLCGEIYQDACDYNASVDPTESVVEWIAEMHFGQLAGFDYPHTMDTHKGPAKTMHWHVANLYYSLRAEQHSSLAQNMRLDHTLFYSRLADRSLDRPPRVA